MFIVSESALKVIAFIGLIPFGYGLFKGRESYFREGRKALFIGLIILLLPMIIQANYPVLTWLVHYKQ